MGFASRHRDDVFTRRAAIDDDALAEARKPARPAPGRTTLVLRELGGSAEDEATVPATAREDTPRAPAGLEIAQQWRMSQAFGFDFSGVSLRRDSPLATGSTRALVKDGEIHVREGAYRPGTRDGDWLIAHELAHVVQQRGGRGERVGSRKELEREADRAATLAVLGRPAPIALRAQPSAVYAFSDDDAHDTHDADARDEHHAGANDSSSAPLPDDLRARLERSTGADLSGVRVHTGDRAAHSAEVLGASAYALGKDIYFARGQYDPASVEGQRLVAHEVAHTVQQGSAPIGGEPLTVSSPSDSHEQEADAFADAFATPAAGAASEPGPHGESRGESRIVPPAQGPRLVAPVTTGVISRFPMGPAPGFPGRPGRWVRMPDIALMGRRDYNKLFQPLKHTVVPVTKGLILVEGVPISYGASMEAESTASLRGAYGPAAITDVRAHLDGLEAFASMGPATDRIAAMLRPRDGTGDIKFSAEASADISASGRLKGDVGIADVFTVGPYAGLRGSAGAKASLDLTAPARYTFDHGRARAVVEKVDGVFKLTLHCALSAFAGIEVELKIPDLPVIKEVKDFSSEMQDVPIVGWFVPDLSRWRWSTKYEREWELFSEIRELKHEFSIKLSGDSPDASGEITHGANLDPKEILDEVFKRKPGKDIPGQDDKMPDHLKDGAKPGTLAQGRDRAMAQISSARKAIEREKKWDADMLAKLGKKLAAAPSLSLPSGSGGGSAPAPAPAPGSGPTPDPKVQKQTSDIEARDQLLDRVQTGVDSLEKKLGGATSAAAAQDGPTKNVATEAYTGIAHDADLIGQNVSGYGASADKFKRPAASDAAVDPTEAAAEAEAERKRAEARRATDDAYEEAKEEEYWTINELDLVKPFPEAAAYRDQVQQRLYNTRWLRQRADKLQDDIGLVERTYPRRKDQLDAYEIALRKAAAIRKDFTGLGKRPAPPWDVDYVAPEGTKLMLLRQWRNGKKIRAEFYPHDYTSATKTWRDHKIGPITNAGGEDFWTYSGALSPRGDNLWKRNAANERPTIDHVLETVGGHWDRSGRLMRWDGRARYYNGFNLHDANLRVVPQQLNSSKGATEDPSVSNFEVNVTFRGKQ